MKALAPVQYVSGSLLALFLVLSSSCAFAPNPTTALPMATSRHDVCSTGASLINPQTGGIGGTGQIALRPGIGGTGQAESIATLDNGGIGGTGIVGVITGFASICVNGTEVHYTQSTPVSLDGNPGDAAELLVGQIVAVRAVPTDNEHSGQLQAQAIAVQHAAVGPLTDVNVTTGEFSVMGQAAVAQKKSQLANLKRNDWVRVSGYRLSNGLIMASYVQALAAPLRSALVRGPVTNVGNHSVQVGTTHVRLQAMPVGLKPGHEVLARGQWNGHYLEATDISIAPTRAELGAVQEVLLQGYVRELRDQELILNDETLRLSKRTVVTNGNLDALKVDQLIQVRGHLNGDGRITIDQLDFGAGRNKMEEAIPTGTGQQNRNSEPRGEQKGGNSSRSSPAGGNGASSGNGSAGR